MNSSRCAAGCDAIKNLEIIKAIRRGSGAIASARERKRNSLACVLILWGAARVTSIPVGSICVAPIHVASLSVASVRAASVDCTSVRVAPVRVARVRATSVKVESVWERSHHVKKQCEHSCFFLIKKRLWGTLPGDFDEEIIQAWILSLVRDGS